MTKEIKYHQITDENRKISQQIIELLHNEYPTDAYTAIAVLSFTLECMQQTLNIEIGAMTLIDKTEVKEDD